MPRKFLAVAELRSSICLPKGPASRCNIVRDHTVSITSGDYKREALPIKIWVALPVLAPIPWHLLPSSSWTLDCHRMHIAGTSNVGDEDKIEVWVAIDGEPDSSAPPARYPSVRYRNNTSSVLCNAYEDRLRKIKVFVGRITPAPWWTEVSSSDGNGTREAPLWVINTFNLETGSTA